MSADLARAEDGLAAAKAVRAAYRAEGFGAQHPFVLQADYAIRMAQRWVKAERRKA